MTFLKKRIKWDSRFFSDQELYKYKNQLWQMILCLLRCYYFNLVAQVSYTHRGTKDHLGLIMGWLTLFMNPNGICRTVWLQQVCWYQQKIDVAPNFELLTHKLLLVFTLVVCVADPGEARGCSTKHRYVNHPFPPHNFTSPTRPIGLKWYF